MRDKAAKEFGEISIENVAANKKFVADMEIHGRRIKVPARGGELEAIFYPAAAGIPAPVIFEINGGCFSQGCVENDDRMRTRMWEATGYNVIGLDYRKSPLYPYPCGLNDVFDEVCYFHDHADEYGIDTSRMAVWGHSAGGNFACELAILAKETGRFSLKAQLLDYPYLDAYKEGIEKTTALTGLTASALDAMNDIYADKETRHGKYLSPVYIDPKELEGVAPAMVVICGKDPLKAEAVEMVNHFMEAGVPVLAREWPDASHGFLEHWFFREWYMDNMSKEERAGIPDNIGEMAEEGMEFVISAAKYFLA